MPFEWFPKKDRVDEKEVRKKADAAAARYPDVPEEKGLEEEYPEDILMPLRGLGRKGLKMAAKEATEVAAKKGALSQLKDKLPEAPPPAAPKKPEGGLNYKEMAKQELAKKRKEIGEDDAPVLTWGKGGDVTRTPAKKEQLSTEEYFRRQALKEKKGK